MIHKVRGGEPLIELHLGPGGVYAMDILDLSFGNQVFAEEKGALHVIAGDEKGDISVCPFLTNSKWLKNAGWLPTVTKSGHTNFKVTALTHDAETKDIIYSAG